MVISQVLPVLKCPKASFKFPWHQHTKHWTEWALIFSFVAQLCCFEMTTNWGISERILIVHFIPLPFYWVGASDVSRKMKLDCTKRGWGRLKLGSGRWAAESFPSFWALPKGAKPWTNHHYHVLGSFLKLCSKAATTASLHDKRTGCWQNNRNTFVSFTDLGPMAGLCEG